MCVRKKWILCVKKKHFQRFVQRKTNILKRPLEHELFGPKRWSKEWKEHWNRTKAMQAKKKNRTLFCAHISLRFYSFISFASISDCVEKIETHRERKRNILNFELSSKQACEWHTESKATKESSVRNLKIIHYYYIEWCVVCMQIKWNTLFRMFICW